MSPVREEVTLRVFFSIILHAASDKQILVEFGANPEEVAQMQALLKGRASKVGGAKAPAATRKAPAPAGAEFSLAESSPRGKRRQSKIPDAFLPKVGP